MGKLKDLTGQTFSRLTVIKCMDKGSDGYFRWLCRCECGKEIIVRGNSLKAKKKGTKSCGCLNKEKVSKMKKLPYGEASLNRGIAGIRDSAKMRNITWEISDERAKELILMNCHYCDATPSQQLNNKKYNGHIKRNGLDRINSNLGYSEGNIVPCCKWCNYAKSDMTHDEFIDWIKRVYKYQNF